MAISGKLYAIIHTLVIGSFPLVAYVGHGKKPLDLFAVELLMEELWPSLPAIVIALQTAACVYLLVLWVTENVIAL